MKTLKITIFFLLILALSVFAEFRIAKDRTPSGLYVVGPDISPDSLEGEFLYYSSNAGTTLVVKDSSLHYSAISADYTTGNVYKVVLERLYHSSDYGVSWIARLSPIGYVLSGFEAGEAYASRHSFFRTADYFETYYSIPGPIPVAGLGCLGWQSGELFLINPGLGTVYYSDDTLSSCVLINDLGYHGFEWATSGRMGEVYLLSTDSIYYSADYGSTFVGTNTFSLEPEESSLMEIVGGGFSGELYGVYVDYYTDEYYEQRGGSIRICYSRNYGATFTCLTHTAEGITYDTLSNIREIAKPERMQIGIYPNPFNSSCKIEAEPLCNLEIYDLQGHLIDNGKTDYQGIFCWKPCNLPTGIYLLKTNDNIAKAFLTK